MVIALECSVFANSSVENPLFGYTHLLPSPFTLPAGKWVLGAQTAIGITDSIQLETDVISTLFKIYNGRAKLSLLDFPGFAVGIYLGYQYVNLNDISSSNPALGLSTWMPGGVIGTEIMPYLALFFGGNLSYPNFDPSALSLSTSGYIQGSQLESDLSWAYNPQKNKTGNVLSSGFTYNTTFNFYGVGISHHWPGFHFGIHYYPNAAVFKFVPILSTGIVFDLN